MISQRRVLFLTAAISALAPAGAARPSASWDESPLKIIQTTPANFPETLASEGIRNGEVRAVINIDAKGNFADCLFLSYTHPAFAREVLANLRTWEFKPARQHGDPVGSRTELSFLFQARGMVVSLTSGDSLTARVNELLGQKPISFFCKSTELDEPLTATKVINPRPPEKDLPLSRSKGTAVLDFYVDSEGRPRMPVVVDASYEWFAAAAVEALLQWQFNPPTRNGRPVAVRVRQEFVFPERS